MHGFESSQSPVSGALEHPPIESQESLVHELPSSQSIDEVPAQAPPAQTSPKVQTSPSSQELALSAYWQPVAGSQESSVHWFESSHEAGKFWKQTPPLQVSPVVQASPSSHGTVLFTY